MKNIYFVEVYKFNKDFEGIFKNPLYFTEKYTLLAETEEQVKEWIRQKYQDHYGIRNIKEFKIHEDLTLINQTI